MSKVVLKRVQQKLHRVADNLYRADGTEILYAIIKRNGKQIKQSLKTTDRKLAHRRLRDVYDQVQRRTKAYTPDLPFVEYDGRGNLIGGLAKRWFDLGGLTWAPSVVERELETIKSLSKYFGHLTVAEITPDKVEQWALGRAAGCEASTFNRDRVRMVGICDFAIRKGIMLDNPIKDIPKRKATKHVPVICSNIVMYRRDSSATNSSGAAGSVASL